MGNWSYYSRDNLKTDLGITDTTDDAALRHALEEASEQLDSYLSRTFRSVSAVRYYTADHRRWLTVNDLLSVTSLKTLTTNVSGTRTYGDTWAAADYDLEPDNAAVDRGPYTRLCVNPEGAYSFPLDQRGVQITGVWGYFQALETSPSVAAEVMDATETGFDVTSGADFDVLDTLLVDSEQMYVTAISTNTLTVVRGVNGTTAATHALSATIQRYTYPSEVVAACRIQAARLYQQSKAPAAGMMGASEPGSIRLRSDLDWDVRNRIDVLRNPAAMV